MDFIFSVNKLYFVLLWILIYFLGAFLTNNYILDNSFYYSSLGSQLSTDRINSVIHLNRKMQWISYFSIPIILLIKWTILSGIIYLGAFLFNQKLLFKDCFHLFLAAEIIPASVILIKQLYFYLYPPESLEALQAFYPFSALQIVDFQKIPVYMIYILQQLNLFEIIYWSFLIIGVKHLTGTSKRISLKIIASSYGIAFCFWMLIILLLQIQFSI